MRLEIIHQKPKSPTHPTPPLKANLTLKHAIGTPSLYRDHFFSAALPEAQLKRYYAQVQEESLRAYLDMMLTRVHPERVNTPVLVLGARDDTLIKPDEVAATAKAYDTEVIFFPKMGHGVMLDVGWQQVVNKETTLNVECRVIRTIAVEQRRIYVGQVIQVYADDAYVTEREGRRMIAPLTELDPIIYGLDNRYYQIGRAIGIGYREEQSFDPKAEHELKG